MVVNPFPRDSSRPLVVHVRTHVLSDRKAPFLLKTVLGLRPYFRNLVITPAVDCAVPADVQVECVALKTLSDPIARWEVVRRLREAYGRPDLVIGHMGNGSRVGVLLAEMMDVPLLGILGGSDVNVEFDKPTYRDVYRRLVSTPCARFLTVADYLRDKLVDKGVEPERLYTWHRGTDLSFARPALHRPPEPGRSLQVGISGRFLEVKGHADLVRALALVRARGVDAVVNMFGDGPLRGELEALAQQLGVAAAVKFHGHLKHDAILDQLAEQDLYVHPSVTCSEGRTEGVPNAIMEAHAAGLPVVATRSGGIPEVVVDGQTGYLVPERNPEALAAKIEALARDREARVAMGARGRAHVAAEFDLRTQSRRLAAHATHLVRQGQLFALRGLRKHAVAGLQGGAGGVDIQARLISAAGRARYASSIPVVGRFIDYARKIAYTSLVKPYLHAFAGELTGFLVEAPSEPPRLVRTPARSQGTAELPSVQLMSQAACSECPHCPSAAPWPDEPCPMDAGCLAAVRAEFARRCSVQNDSARPSRGGVVRVEQLAGAAALPYADASQQELTVRGQFAAIADADALFREVARVLAVDGEVLLDVSWGPDAAAEPVPFAAHLFGSSGDQAPSLAGPGWDGRARTLELLEAAGRSGLRRTASTDAMRRLQEPCPVDFQARFSVSLQRLGASYEEAAIGLCCVLAKINAGTH
ncbi:MAG: hypothetical protein RL398_123 [Planctomycetota bacterium]